MNQKTINSLVSEIFENRVNFSNTFGTEKLMDARYMLISDVLLEDIDKLSSVLVEEIHQKASISTQINPAIFHDTRLNK